MKTEKTVTRRSTSKKEVELVYTKDNCTGCGMCAEVCPVSAIGLGPTGAVVRNVVDADYINVSDKCITCGTCAKVCMFDALAIYTNGVRKEIESIGKSIAGTDCDACNLCVKVCPRDCIELERIIPPVSSYAEGDFKMDMDKCNYCGICEDICPTGALIVERGGVSTERICFNHACLDTAITEMAGVSTEQIDSTGTPSRFERLELDEDKCIMCGICARACPTDTLTVTKTGDHESKIEIKGAVDINTAECAWCGWCEIACPHDNIKIEKPFEGTIELLEDRCQGCGACVEICPTSALYFPLTEYPEISECYDYSEGWCKPLKTRPAPTAKKLDVHDDRCVSCGACVRSCPVDAIMVTRDSVRFAEELSKASQNVLKRVLGKVEKLEVAPGETEPTRLKKVAEKVKN